MNKTIKALLFAIMFVGFFYLMTNGLQKAREYTELGESYITTIPDATYLEHLSGSEDLADQSNYVLHIFATWCTHCKESHENIRANKNQDNMKYYGIFWQSKPEDIKKWQEKYVNIYDGLWYTSDANLMTDFGMTGVPEIFIVGKDRKVIKAFRGVVSYQEMMKYFPQ